MVAPFVGAWIEIKMFPHVSCGDVSLRSSERGLKCLCAVSGLIQNTVAPFVGAWIEIYIAAMEAQVENVAPFVGAWIEIGISFGRYGLLMVAPFVGAWIEISSYIECRSTFRSLRSSERGLKSILISTAKYLDMSLRSSERGLKFHIGSGIFQPA